jgi:hypothetical protein
MFFPEELIFRTDDQSSQYSRGSALPSSWRLFECNESIGAKPIGYEWRDVFEDEKCETY